MTKKEQPSPDEIQEEVMEEIIEVIDIDFEVDMSSLTLNDLELLSVISEGSQKDIQAIPGYRLIRFVKRVGGEELGDRPQSELIPILKAIGDQIQAIQNPEGPQGKN